MKPNIKICRKCEHFSGRFTEWDRSKNEFVTKDDILCCGKEGFGMLLPMYRKNKKTLKYKHEPRFQFPNSCPYILEQTVSNDSVHPDDMAPIERDFDRET